MEFLSYFLPLAIAMWVGWTIRGISILSKFSHDPEYYINILQQIKKINETENRETKEKVIGVEVKAEEVSGCWYAYSADGDQFLGQGPTLEDALKMASDRFPDKKFWHRRINKVSHSI